MFPYDFFKRAERAPKGGHIKREPSEFHDRLNQNCFDIAFEIAWTTLTPTALNPVIDPSQSESPKNLGKFSEEGYYSGYNRRWLMIDQRLAISPFTVKSAIANAYANLVGGCYRVNTRIESHKVLDRGKYLYGGGYKRYRVAMDGSSKPGIILSIQKLRNGDRKVVIQPVKEYYLDSNPKQSLKNGVVYYVKEIEKRGYRPYIVTLSNKSDPRSFPVKYHGSYRWGKDQRPSNKHYHRFYVEKGDPVEGIIPAINFCDRDTLKKYVSIGGADANGVPKEWYQDLRDLKTGSFVYYEEFSGVVTHIGKNFLFKALFFHEDTIPEPNRSCKDLTKLCPRCRLFGMIKGDKIPFNPEDCDGEPLDIPDSSDTPSALRGRFKASTLFNNRILIDDIIKTKIPLSSGNSFSTIAVETIQYLDSSTKEVVCKQYLLPILGEPKPNKRDIDGYYEKLTGMIKGAKYYCHAHCDIDALVTETDSKTTVGKTDDKKMPYAHELRNFAVVCKPGENFRGTVGVENATVQEIAALILLLDTSLIDFGFKVGLGKSLGMGSIASKIQRIWIRGSDYNWKTYDLKDFLMSHKEISKELESLRKTCRVVNRLIREGDSHKVPSHRLNYPEPGLYYWRNRRRCEHT